MRCFFVFVTSLMAVFASCQQIRQNDSSEKKGEENNSEALYSCIFLVEPSAHPDFATWSKYLQDNLELDSAEVSKIPAGNYTVIIQFAVEADGRLTELKLVKKPGFGLGEKVLKVFDNYRGRWAPAEQSGKPVKSYRKQPITFIIEEEAECESAILLPEWV